MCCLLERLMNSAEWAWGTGDPLGGSLIESVTTESRGSSR